MSFDSIYKYLKENVDWQSHVNRVEFMGPQLNGRNDRFKKAEILERAICNSCRISGDMEWKNENGRDIFVHSQKEWLEGKYQSNSIVTAALNRKHKIGKNITLMNSRGTNKRRELPDDYASYLLIMDSRAAVLLKKPEPRQIQVNGDSISLLGLSWEEVKVIFDAKDYAPSFTYESLSREEKNFFAREQQNTMVRFDQLVRSKIKKKGV